MEVTAYIPRGVNRAVVGVLLLASSVGVISAQFHGAISAVMESHAWDGRWVVVRAGFPTEGPFDAVVRTRLEEPSYGRHHGFIAA